MKVKIRKGDQVEVITGRLDDKGKRGEVIKVIPAEDRVVVQGINLRAKHQRQVQSQGRTVNPGIIRFEAPLSISNVMVVCKKCNKPTRIALVREEKKTKRFCKECNADLDL
jgi:large subunit ribosomal protein L24